MNNSERIFSDIEDILTGIVTPVDWSSNKDLQMAYIVARDVAKAAIDAYKAKLAGQEPAAWLHRTDPARAISKWQRDAAIKAGGAIEKKSKEIFSLPAYAVNNPSTSDGPLTDEGTKSLEQRRVEFEVWAKNEGYDLRRNVTRGWPSLFVNYLNPLTQVAYGAWQASKGVKE